MKELPIQAFLTRCQLWEACASAGDNREALEYIYFDNGYAYASNSHILVHIPISYVTTLDDEMNHLLDGHGIHGPLMKYLTGLWPLRVEREGKDVCIYAKHGANEIKVTLTNPDKIRPPKFDEVLKHDGERVPISKIGISQRELKKLTSALGTTEIALGFVKENQKIYVAPISLEMSGAEGVIMPLMITGTLDGF